MQPWWSTWPGRAEHEYQCLDAARIRYDIDPAAEDAGILRLRISMIGDEAVNLVATYPDLFPFFRPTVHHVGEDLGMTHHIAPFSGDLCLLGRRTDAWSPNDTLAWLLTEQLPKTLTAGARRDDQADAEALDRLEEHQAEPFTEYYAFADGAAIMVDGAWEMPADDRRGRLAVGFRQIHPAVAGGTLGAVLRVENDNQDELAVTDVAAPDWFPHEVPARWVRLDEPVRANDPKAILAAAETALESLGDRTAGKWGRVPFYSDRKFQVLGVVFPEERAHRASADGWVFLLRVQHDPRQGQAPSKRRGAKGFGHFQPPTETHLVRAGYAGRTDMAARVPELQGLAAKHVVVLGLGALGGTVAEHLARAGVGEVTLIDRDRLEPGNLVRHCASMAYAGWPKAAAVQDIVYAVSPHTTARSAQFFLGGPRPETEPRFQQDFLLELIGPADLVVDCTAEKGVHRFLSWFCSRRQKDLLVVSASNGGWGGRTVRLLPRPGAACWMCVEHALDEDNSPLEMPAAPDDQVQPPGCADPTFTGTGFDLAEVALQTVRASVGMLQRDTDHGYPETGHDVHVLALRDSTGAAIPPVWTGHPLPVHPACPNPDHAGP
jgi:molybdopterin/thiamine biosynthesis adenylyltransferase